MTCRRHLFGAPGSAAALNSRIFVLGELQCSLAGDSFEEDGKEHLNPTYCNTYCLTPIVWLFGLFALTPIANILFLFWLVRAKELTPIAC